MLVLEGIRRNNTHMKIKNFTPTQKQEERITNFLQQIKTAPTEAEKNQWKQAYIDYCSGIADTINDWHIADMQDFMEVLKEALHGCIGD